LGHPILALLVTSLITGILIGHRPPIPRANLVVWTFAQPHARTYRDPLPGPDGGTAPSLALEFQDRTGFSVAIDLMGQLGENVRLVSLFMSQAAGPRLPDLCEIEIDSIGQFLRPPVQDIGLLPLNDFLQTSGWDHRILPSRFAPWSKIDPRTGERIIFGVPEDVHPVTITYRKDLFDEAGIDPQTAGTWEEFQNVCLQFQAYCAAHGRADARAIALSTHEPDEIVEMLLQRHINLVDESDGVHLTDPKVLQTVVFYAQLIAGPRAIGTDASPGVVWTSDLQRGNVCAAVTPDWRALFIAQYAPDLAGKVRMMPLPKFDDTDAPTSTLGGTMIGIPRQCRRPRDAWKLLEFLCLSPDANRARLAAGNDVIPPIPQYWSEPIYHQPDPFFADGQKINELYIWLAAQIPERFVTPYTYEAELALTAVVERAEDYVAEHQGTDGLEPLCAQWLAEAQDDLQRRIEFGKAP
jgi:arabinosaccharide transport system substrate-binding protein